MTEMIETAATSASSNITNHTHYQTMDENDAAVVIETNYDTATENEKKDSDSGIFLLDSDDCVSVDEDDDDAVVPPKPELWGICIRGVTGERTSLLVQPTSTVFQVKQQCEYVTGYPPSEQRYFFMGQELPDSVALCGALVSDNDFIDCIFSNIPVLPNEIDPLFPICVKSWMGGQATLHVRLFDSVLNIKQQLEVKVGIPASLQRLFLYGQEVADEQVVIDTHIRQRCVVDVVFCTVSGVDEE